MRRERRELWPSADTAPPAAETVGFDIGFPFGFGAGASGARQHAFRGRVSRREGQLEMRIRVFGFERYGNGRNLHWNAYSERPMFKHECRRALNEEVERFPSA